MHAHVRPFASTRDRAAAHALIDRITEAEGFSPVGERARIGIDHGAFVLGVPDGDAPLGVAVVIPGSPPAVEVAVPRDRPEVTSRLLESVTAEHRVLRAWSMRDMWGPHFVAHGFTVERVLHRMEVPLPVEGPNIDLSIRGFGEADAPALVAVNAAAFAGHPEQGGLTEDDIRVKSTLEWWDPDGIRLAWDGDRLAGFCWTKVHPGSVGEIYVIGLHPDYHGRGWGRALTTEGLRFLAVERGCGTGMLHVDAANEAALTSYREIGFRTVSVDRAYLRDTADPSSE